MKGLFESERGIQHEHSKQQSQDRQENSYTLVAIQASVKVFEEQGRQPFFLDRGEKLGSGLREEQVFG